MVSTYTDDLGLNKQGDNDNPDGWGDILNEEVFELLEEAITGKANKSDVDLDAAVSDRTLEILDGIASDVSGLGTNKARCGVLRLLGALGNDITLNLPTIYKTYIINCAHTNGVVSISHSGTATLIPCNPGDIISIYTDPTDVYLVSNISSGGGGGSSFLDASNNLSDLTDNVQAILNLGVYPVGASYMSTNATDPSLLFGGTWQTMGEGRVLIGAGTSTNDDRGESRAFSPGELGGEFQHVTTVPEMPSHTHPLDESRDGGGTDFGTETLLDPSGDRETESTGGDQPHNNMQPYLAGYMWERIS